MSVVEFPRVRVSKALSGFRWADSRTAPLPRGLLVGSQESLDRVRQGLAGTRAGREATWHEAADFAAASAFLSACRVDIVLIAAEAASGVDWRRFCQFLAGMALRPHLFAFGDGASAETIQELLDQGADGVLSLDALRLIEEAFCDAPSGSPRSSRATMASPPGA